MTNKYFDKDNRFLTIQMDMLDNLKKLKSVRTESAYVDFISRWYVESNPFFDGSDKTIPNVKATNYHGDINNLYLSKYTDLITAFTKLVVIPQSFIDEYDVKPYHIKLIRSLYFDIDIDDDDDDGLSMSIGYKRPYGDSSVLSDVSEAYLENDKSPFTDWAKKQNLEDYGLEKDDDLDELLYEWEDQEYDFLNSVHMKTLDILDKMLQELSLRCLILEASSFNNWSETYDGLTEFIKASRLKKLNKVVGK